MLLTSYLLTSLYHYPSKTKMKNIRRISAYYDFFALSIWNWPIILCSICTFRSSICCKATFCLETEGISVITVFSISIWCCLHVFKSYLEFSSQVWLGVNKVKILFMFWVIVCCKEILILTNTVLSINERNWLMWSIMSGNVFNSYLGLSSEVWIGCKHSMRNFSRFGWLYDRIK